MALGTITVNDLGTKGNVRSVVASFALDSSYPTGGSSLTAADLGLKGGTILWLVADAPAGYVLDYDYANSKLQAYLTGAALSGVLAQVANTTNLSAVTARVFAIVKGV